MTDKFPSEDQKDAQPQQSLRLEDLWGTIRRVSAAPTWTPRGRLIDQFAFYVNGATYRLYVYDEISKAWRYTALT